MYAITEAINVTLTVNVTLVWGVTTYWKMVCGCLWSGVIKNGHKCNPLNLWNVFLNVQLHIYIHQGIHTVCSWELRQQLGIQYNTLTIMLTWQVHSKECASRFYPRKVTLQHQRMYNNVNNVTLSQPHKPEYCYCLLRSSSVRHLSLIHISEPTRR